MLVEDIARFDGYREGRQLGRCALFRPAQPSPFEACLVLSWPWEDPHEYKASPLPIALTSYRLCSTFVQLPPSNEMIQWSTPPPEQHQE